MSLKSLPHKKGKITVNLNQTSSEKNLAIFTLITVLCSLSLTYTHTFQNIVPRESGTEGDCCQLCFHSMTPIPQHRDLSPSRRTGTAAESIPQMIPTPTLAGHPAAFWPVGGPGPNPVSVGEHLPGHSKDGWRGFYRNAELSRGQGTLYTVPRLVTCPG